ncbi:MAG: DUF262 domain-containing protein [Methanobrevibacter sp.]|jgi:hypothetical protein|nr:DUF262 domain-containing protein [Candidatus Methanoflexus mossambicus]
MTNVDEEINSKRSELRSERLDMSFGEIIRMYIDREILIDPDYQRLFRWNLSKRTYFIESLLLNLPIPPIFIAENDENQWEVVDGLQRISTILSFCNVLKMPDNDKPHSENGWELEKGDLIENLEGLSYDHLSRDSQFLIKRYICRMEVLKSDSKIDMRYELFKRLNTGGTTLTDQEIRNCIFRGESTKFNKFLNEKGNEQAFIDLIDPTPKKKQEKYLEELVLRFCSLYNNADNINHNISEHMTDFMKYNIKNYNKIDELRVIWEKLIKIISPLGRDIFRAKSNGYFSTAIYDGIMVGIAQNLEKYEKDSSGLKEKIELYTDKAENKGFIGSQSHNKNTIKNRLLLADAIFKDSHG